MKTQRVIITVVLSFLMAGWTTVNAQQNRVEVPGDHFSLEGALQLFKQSASPEEFERMLNASDARVNNLDLNGDGSIDYIRVIDRNEGNVHAFILQAIVSETESQDVAVIELEKLANGKAVLQITGDADIYGMETIIEPTEEVRINAGSSTARTVVNVWSWPSVQYVYSPYYYGWTSPWSWSYRPIWWRPWRPVTYVTYYSYWEPYRPYYTICNNHRVVYAQQIYRPYRHTSVIVYNRHHSQIDRYRSTYPNSYSNRGNDHNNRYYNSNNNRSTDQRGRQVSSQHGNSNNTSNDWGRNRNEGNRTSSSTVRDRSSFENRSGNKDTQAPAGWQRNTVSGQKQNTERRSDFVNADRSYKQRDVSFGNTPVPSRNRESTVRSDNAGNAGQGSRGQEVRPSNDFRSSQRSVVQTERRSAPGNSAVQRSENNGGGGVKKSTDHRRGRD